MSVVNVALPAMQDGLHLGATGLQWVINGYTIAYAGFLLLGGRLADVIGQRRAFLAGVGLFVAGSLVGGLAGPPACSSPVVSSRAWAPPRCLPRR